MLAHDGLILTFAQEGSGSDTLGERELGVDAKYSFTGDERRILLPMSKKL